MKEYMNIGKRLVALVLVFFMVVGYVPFGVFAEESTDVSVEGSQNTPDTAAGEAAGDTTGGSTDTPVEDNETPSGDTDVPSGDTDVPSGDTDVPSGDTDVPSEDDTDTPEEDTETPSDEEPEETEPTGILVVKLTHDSENAGGKIVAVTYRGTEVSEATEEEPNGYVCTWESNTATISYLGFVLTVTLNDDDASAVAAMDISVPEVSAVKGTIVTTEPVLYKNGVPVAFPADWTASCVMDEAYIDENGVAVQEATDAKIGICTITCGDTVIAELDITGTITAPEFTVNITNAADNSPITADKWYAEAQTVRVAVDAGVEFDDESVLPTLTIGGTAQAWSNHADSTVYYVEQEISATSTIAVADQSVQVGIDTVVPVINSVRAYITAEGTAFVIDLTVGDSGVASRTITSAGTAYGSTEFTELKDVTDFVLAGVNLTTVDKLEIVNGAGVSAVWENIDVTPEVEAAVTLINGVTVGTAANNKTYLKPAGEDSPASLKVSVTNASNGIAKVEARYVGADGFAVTKEITAVDGEYCIPVEEGCSNYRFIVTDGDGRTAEATYAGTFSYDETPPQIQGSCNVESNIITNKDDVTFTVTVSDDYLDLENNGTITVIAVVNGEEVSYTAQEQTDGTYAAVIPVADGEKLETVTVKAMDSTGNSDEKIYQPQVTVDLTAPVVTITASDNVLAFYTADGKIFAQVADDEAETTVEFTVTVTDTNMPDAPEGWENWQRIYTVPVSDDETGVELSIELDAFADLAGNLPAADVVIESHGNATDTLSTTLVVPTNKGENGENLGTYSLELVFDRRAPSSDAAAEAPEVKLSISDEIAAGNVIYTGDVEFTMTITDNGVDGKLGSGIASVEVTVDDGLDADYLSIVEKSSSTENGVTTYEYALALNGKNETAAAKITITAIDNLGNIYTFTTNTFGVDNLAPRVTVTYDNNDPTDEDRAFYAEGRIATVQIEDLNFDASGIQVTSNGEKVAISETDPTTFEYHFTHGGAYNFSITVTDKVGNETVDADVNYGNSKNPNYFVTDIDAPKILVKQELAGTGALKQNGETTAYYNNEVTYTVTITDTSLYAGCTSLVVYWADQVQPQTIEGTVESGATGADPDTVTYTFTVKDGQVLTGMEFTAVDEAEFVSDEDDLTVSADATASFAYADGVWTYTGKDIAVDTAAPVIQVTKETEDDEVRTSNGTDYYNKEVTYTVTITDSFLEAGNTSLVVSFEGEGDRVIAAAQTSYSDLLQGKDEIVYTFTVKDGEVMTGMQLVAVDASGNAANAKMDNLTVTEAEEKTTFSFANDTWIYTGNPVVVDTTPAEISIAVNHADGTYTNKPVTLDVSVQDTFLDLADGAGEITVDYWISTNEATPVKHSAQVQQNHQAGAYTFSLTLTDGQTLTKVEVYAKDNAGNESTGMKAPWVTYDITPPVVTIEASENVKSFYTDPDDNIFVQVEGSEGEDAVVTFTATVSDQFLGEVPAGWALAGSDWQKTFTVTIPDNDTGLSCAIEILNIQDLATNVPVADVTIKGSGSETANLKSSTTISAEDGNYALTLVFDRREPSSDAAADVPEVKLSISEDIANGKIFTGDTDFTMVVTDRGANNALGSGIDDTLTSVTVNDGLEGVEFLTIDRISDSTEDGVTTYNYVLSFDEENVNETDAVEITITLVDYLGNTYSYTTNTFGADNWAPRVEVTYDNNEPANTNEEYSFYDAPRYVTVVVTDLNYDPTGVIVETNGFRDVRAETEAGTGRYMFENVDEYEFYIRAADVVGNLTADEDLLEEGETKYTAVTYVGSDVHHFVVDTTAPVIEVEKTVEEGSQLIQTADGVDYYNGEVTYTVTITDETLNHGESSLYLAWESVEEVQKIEPVTTMGEENLMAGDKTVYTFTVTDGQVLTGMTLVARDSAMNYVDASKSNLTVKDDDGVTSFVYSEDTNSWIWSEESAIVVVDKTAPVIHVAKTMVADVEVEIEGTDPVETETQQVSANYYAQTYGTTDYYNGEVTYTVTITDTFLEAGQTGVKYTYEMNGESSEVILDAEPENEAAAAAKTGSVLDGEELTYTFTLTDGQMLTGIEIVAIDSANNTYAAGEDVNENLTVEDENGLTSFAYDAEKAAWDYTGNPVVVDMTNPTVSLKFSENVVGIYKNGDKVYVIVKNPTEGESGVPATGDPVDVELTITVLDKNLALDSENSNGVTDRVDTSNGKWTGTPTINVESTLEYYDSVTEVKVDQATYFVYNLRIADLAGNLLTADYVVELEIEGVENGATSSFKADVDENGYLANTIAVDRRRAYSSLTGEDEDVPTIEITPNQADIYTSTNKLDLFQSTELQFTLKVSDLFEEETDTEMTEEEAKLEAQRKTSGIKSITYSITDEAGFVTEVLDYVLYVNDEDTEDDEPGEYITEKIVTIPVTFTSELGESNSIKLHITVVDNAGNTITYVKSFAVDNLAPRVTVSYDNNDVLNGKYFKADRTATITVEDINFNEAETIITTQVTPTEWVESEDGSVHTATCTYNVDGEYTFAMTCKDLATNESVIDLTNGDRNAAPDDFVIDKTAPVINVNFTPSVAVDKDENNVWYFDTDRKMTVSITEVNFNGAEVRAEMGTKNALSYWNSNGSYHQATTTFTEGNNYSVIINYTDLAGNPAVTYKSETFSVDLTAPTITITKGDLDNNKSLNIVQGDLSLAFTINDGQSNLKPNYTVKVMHLNNNLELNEVSGVDYYAVSGEDQRTTVLIDFNSIAQEKANDGLYFISITCSDYAGHIVTLNPEMCISLNRYGSSFRVTDASTQSFLTASSDGNIYQNAVAAPLVIEEINPNRVWQDSSRTNEGSLITILVNGETIVLEENVDYTLSTSTEASTDDKCHIYTYSINPAVFSDSNGLVNGQYTLMFYSEDEAGNKNTNESNVDLEGNPSAKINFTLDDQAPVITVIGITDGQQIRAEYQRVEISTSDNIPVGIIVTIDGVEIAQYESMDDLSDNMEWVYRDPNTNNYILNMVQDSDRRDISIEATDAAGNPASREILNVQINSNAFILFLNNFWAVGAVLLILLAVIAAIILLNKRKMNQA